MALYTNSHMTDASAVSSTRRSGAPRRMRNGTGGLVRGDPATLSGTAGSECDAEQQRKKEGSRDEVVGNDVLECPTHCREHRIGRGQEEDQYQNEGDRDDGSADEGHHSGRASGAGAAIGLCAETRDHEGQGREGRLECYQRTEHIDRRIAGGGQRDSQEHERGEHEDADAEAISRDRSAEGKHDCPRGRDHARRAYGPETIAEHREKRDHHAGDPDAPVDANTGLPEDRGAERSQGDGEAPRVEGSEVRLRS